MQHYFLPSLWPTSEKNLSDILALDKDWGFWQCHCFQNLHLLLSQAITPAFICLIFITKDIYEKTEPLISQTAAWAVCPSGPQFISWDKGRQVRACVEAAPGAAGRFDTGGILFASTGLDWSESGRGVKIGICLGCFTGANVTEFHPNCAACQPRQFSVSLTDPGKQTLSGAARWQRVGAQRSLCTLPLPSIPVQWHLVG